MPRKTRCTTVRALLGCGILLLFTLAVNCNERKAADSAGTPRVDTQPGETMPADAEADGSAKARTAETQTTGPATQPKPVSPATQPATKPEPAEPVSTYDSKPPYPVSLFVRSPEEKQPGWLRIEELAEPNQRATAQGRFPEQNRIYVDTSNVSRIRIHVTHLPLRPNERVILQIDGQGMVISRSRTYTTLERSPAGVWSVMPEK